LASRAVDSVRGHGGTRDRFFDAASEFTPLLAVDSEHARFLVSTADEMVGRSLFRRLRRGEMVTLGKAISILGALKLGRWTQGTTFLDIGANIGTSAITALQAHDFHACVACEPEPENHRLLKVNAALNDVSDRLLALQVAVSNARGVANLHVNRENSGGHQVIDDAHDHRAITVETVSVDYLVDRGILDAAEVGMIWIDAQGYEGHILKGATRLTARGVPSVLEFHPVLLRQSGGTRMLMDSIRKGYTDFVDLRDVRAGGEQSFELRPAADIGALRNELLAPQGTSFTDILIINREAEVV
jgi:FkbM family methyltransferase